MPRGRSGLTMLRLGRLALEALGRAWSQLWFQTGPTTPMEAARIWIGATMIRTDAFNTPWIFYLYGESGMMPLSLVFELDDDPWRQSIFFYLWADWQLLVFHIFFVLCCGAFMLGWHTTWVKWVVWVGQVSYVVRNQEV